MWENWTDHLEFLTEKLFPDLEDFNRDDPFPCSPDVWSYFSQYIKSFNSGKVHKSLDISWDYLNQGNTLCECIHERISCYSQSIFHAPHNSPPLLIAYLKRCELLNETGHVRESKNDSAMAFQCFINCMNKSENEMSVDMDLEVDMLEKLVRETLREINIPEEEFSYVEHEIMRILKTQCTSVGPGIVGQTDEWHLPALKDGENMDFPSSSNALRVEFSKRKGRHVVANCDIKMGDILFVEEPFSHVVHKLCCSHCCQRRFTYFPCKHCRDVQYCCKECRDEDWNSCHKYECGFVDLLKQTGIGHLSLKTFLKAESNIDSLKNLSHILKAKETCSNTVFSRVKYENVYNLLTHSEAICTMDFLQYSLTALLLSFYLIHYAHYAEETDENIRFCATILLRHIIQLVTNAQAITAIETRIDEKCAVISEEEEEQIGSAIFPSVSIMNHSCEPSVFITFHRYYIIVKAGKDIKKGEEVYNSYGVDCRRMRRRDRQEVLKAQYLFDCKCERCCEKYDRYDVLNSFKCRECKGPLVKESEMERSMVSEERICLNCSQHQLIPEEILSAEFYTGELLNLGQHYLEENNISEALLIFLKAWKLSRQFLFAFHKNISNLAKKIALCLFRLNYLKDCMKVLSCSILCVEGRFGLYSSELVIEVKKLSDVISYYYRNAHKTKSVFVPDILTHKEKEYALMCKKILRILTSSVRENKSPKSFCPPKAINTKKTEELFKELQYLHSSLEKETLNTYSAQSLISEKR